MGYAAVPMRAEHRESLLRLWKENMTDPRISHVLSERHQWLYGGNPEGSAVTVVGVHEGRKEVVGCGSVLPRRMTIEREELLVGVPVDFAITRKHRVGGAAIAIQRALVQDGSNPFQVLLAYPNAVSAPVFKHIGYKVIGSATGWVKPLKAGYKVRNRLFNGFASAAVTFGINVSLQAMDALHVISSRSCTTELRDRADAGFDRLWHNAKSGYRVAGTRSAQYLNWRYANFTTERYRFFCLVRPDGELSGYVAFKVEAKRVFVADMFATDMGATARQLLVRFAIEMRRQGYESVFVAFAGNTDFERVLKYAGFFKSSGAPRPVLAFVRGLTALQEGTLLDPRNWYMFDGEMDI